MNAATAARGLLIATAAFLLTSMGGAGIVAAPVTIPLLLVAARSSPSLAFRRSALVVACLTGFEGGWGLGYVLVGPGFATNLIFPIVLVLLVLAAYRFLLVPSRNAAPAA